MTTDDKQNEPEDEPKKQFKPPPPGPKELLARARQRQRLAGVQDVNIPRHVAMLYARFGEGANVWEKQ